MSSTTFGALGVPAALVSTLAERDVSSPTPIQAATLPDSLAGRDVLGRGRTGSGKTYAFLLPLVTRLAGGRRTPKRPRALILAPTRELVSQIDEALAPLAATVGLTSRTIFGGVGQNPQVTALRNGVDIIVACPGRLEDLLEQGHVTLDAIEVTVLDEADHMADLGFLPAVRRLLDRTPGSGQRMMFSATLDKAVHTLVTRYLHHAVTHEADSAQSPIATMDHHVLHVSAAAHPEVLIDLAAAPGRTVIFTRTKHRAKALTRKLNGAGVPAVELHGNLSQNARTRTMDAFHSGEVQTLVATDIAARGIHVDDIALVVHADPPAEHKAYLHRSGRTARAGAAGTVVTLMTDSQRSDVRDLMRKAGIRPTTSVVAVGHPALQDLAPGKRAFPGGHVTPASHSEAGSGGGRRGSRPAQARSGKENAPKNAQRSGQTSRGSAASPRPAAGRNGGRSQSRRSSNGAAAFSARVGRG